MKNNKKLLLKVDTETNGFINAKREKKLENKFRKMIYICNQIINITL